MLFSEFRAECVSLMNDIDLSVAGFDAAISKIEYVRVYSTTESHHVINAETHLDDLRLDLA